MNCWWIVQSSPHTIYLRLNYRWIFCYETVSDSGAIYFIIMTAIGKIFNEWKNVSSSDFFVLPFQFICSRRNSFVRFDFPEMNHCFIVGTRILSYVFVWIDEFLVVQFTPVIFINFFLYCALLMITIFFLFTFSNIQNFFITYNMITWLIIPLISCLSL